MHEGNDESSEVHQLLKRRIMKRGFAVASSAAERLLMQPAKSRDEWKELCEGTEDSLQRQMHHQIDPLAQPITRDLQVLLAVVAFPA